MYSPLLFSQNKLLSVLLCVFFSFFSPVSKALDVVKFGAPQSELDERFTYPIALLTRALKATEASHGPFKIESAHKMTRNRSLVALQKGELINVLEVVTSAEWEEKLLPVYIPIRKGLMGYRLLLIHKDNQEKLDAVQNISDLKPLVAGLGQQWSITDTMKHFGFRVSTSLEYEKLFLLLQIKRFDYFPRGVNEIFTELEARDSRYPGLKIEPKKALYMPLPSYFFVSPTAPKLAQRIEKGLAIMINDGSFDALFNEHFAEMIEKANLPERVIYKIDNPLIPDNKIFENESLWFRK
jgi:hypothetical protein